MKNNNFLDPWIRFFFHLFRFFRHIYPKWKLATILMYIYIYSIYKNEIHFPIIWISLLRYIRICILIYIYFYCFICKNILRKGVGLLYKLLNVPEINPLSLAISIFQIFETYKFCKYKFYTKKKISIYLKIQCYPPLFLNNLLIFQIFDII